MAKPKGGTATAPSGGTGNPFVDAASSFFDGIETLGILLNPLDPKNPVFGEGGLAGELDKSIFGPTGLGGVFQSGVEDATGTGLPDRAGPGGVTRKQFQTLFSMANVGEEGGLTEEEFHELIGAELGDPATSAQSSLSFSSAQQLIEDRLQQKGREADQQRLLGLSNEVFDEQIGRTRSALDLDDIGDDPLLGGNVRTVTNQTLALEQQAGRDAASRAANRGGGFGGSVISTVNRAREFGQQQRGRADFNARGGAISRLDALGQGKLGAEQAILSGTRFDPLEFIATTDRDIGLDLVTTGQRDKTIGNVTGQVQHAFDTTLGAVSGITDPITGRLVSNQIS